MDETMIRNLEEKTGKKFAEWIRIANSSGLSKHGELMKFLKDKHGLTHGYANLVIHRARGSDAATALGVGIDLVQVQYKGRESLFPYYQKLMKAIKSFGPDVEVAPKKPYVSIRRKKQFALIQPSTRSRLDVGLNLKGVKPQGALETAGSFNAMCTHLVKVEDQSAVSQELIKWLQTGLRGCRISS
jgi:hypothetical protein